MGASLDPGLFHEEYLPFRRRPAGRFTASAYGGTVAPNPVRPPHRISFTGSGTGLRRGNAGAGHRPPSRSSSARSQPTIWKKRHVPWNEQSQSLPHDVAGEHRGLRLRNRLVELPADLLRPAQSRRVRRMPTSATRSVPKIAKLVPSRSIRSNHFRVPRRPPISAAALKVSSGTGPRVMAGTPALPARPRAREPAPGHWYRAGDSGPPGPGSAEIAGIASAGSARPGPFVTGPGRISDRSW